MYGKKEATMTKGLAIITMVLLHLFCRKGADVFGTPLIWINDETPLVYYLGFFSDICVPLYAICAGYAQWVLENRGGDHKLWKDNLKRIFKLMTNYWIILVLFTILGILLPSDGSMPGSGVKFLKSIVLLYRYNGAWWFLNTYIILMIIPSIFLLLPVRKLKPWIGICTFICVQIIFYLLVDKFGLGDKIYFDNQIVEFVWNEFIHFMRVLPYFYVGAFLCKGKTIDRVKKIMDKYVDLNKQNKVLFLVFVCLFLGVSVIHKAVLVLINAIVVFLIFNLWKKRSRIEKIFLFLGKHSTNIWLTHMFFYLRVFPGLVQRTKYPLFMFMYMMILCCLVSEIIFYIQNKLNKLWNNAVV